MQATSSENRAPLQRLQRPADPADGEVGAGGAGAGEDGSRGEGLRAQGERPQAAQEQKEAEGMKKIEIMLARPNREQQEHQQVAVLHVSERLTVGQLRFQVTPTTMYTCI